MFTFIQKISKYAESNSLVFLLKKSELDLELPISEEEHDYLKAQHKDHEQSSFLFDRLHFQIYIEIIEEKSEDNHTLELLRKTANGLLEVIQKKKTQEIFILGPGFNATEILAFTEGMVLGNYRFTAYKTKKGKTIRYLETIKLVSENISQEQIEELNILMEATLTARTLVNKPVNYLNATELSEEIKNMAYDSGAKIEIFNKNKIEALKMGGLLAVNQGSPLPPTFSIFEYKPENAVNSKPLIFVGKGVVYDTGGLNIKTGVSMNDMKCDMGGAAAASAAAFAIAKAKLPLYVMALVPATDNRPGEMLMPVEM